MENNDILSRLMADGQVKEQELSSVVEEELVQDLDLSAARVAGVRYKVSILIFSFFILFLIIYAVLPSWDAWQVTRGQLATQKQTMKTFETKKKEIDTNIAFIDLIQSGESDIISCVNNKQGCASLDTGIKQNFALARSFLLLSDLNDEKMKVNEKILLKNINEYLLKGYTSNVENISFGDSELVEGNLYSVPVQIRVQFDDKDTLFGFIDRVDKEIPSTSSLRVLYKLDEVSYDIMHYRESQSVDLALHAFYYQE